MRLTTENLQYALNQIDEQVMAFNKNHTPIHPRLVGEEVSHKKAYYRAVEQGDFDAPMPTGEGANYPELGSEMPFHQDFVAIKYAGKYTVSREAMYTDQTGGFKGSIGSIVRNPMNMVARRYMNVRDQTASDAYANGFTAPASGGTPTLDGVAQFSALHTITGGQTVSNLATTALSVAAVETAIQALMNQKTYQGAPWVYSGEWDLIVPPGLAMLAKRIAESTLLQGTTNNDKNVAGNYLNVIINPYFVDQSDWFLKPSQKSYNPLTRIKRLPFETFNDSGDGGSMITTFHEEWVDAFFNWRGTYGSQV